MAPVWLKAGTVKQDSHGHDDQEACIEVRDTDCVEFLQWALPQLRLRWEGFRKVRKQVCKRVQRRIRELGLVGIDAYREQLRCKPEEWRALERTCRVTISRFYRDQGVFRSLEEQVLPELGGRASARGDPSLRVWSAGCGCGEEPYTLALLWRVALARQYPRLNLRVLATDIDPELLRRAQRACYPAGSVKGLPKDWLNWGFEVAESGCCLKYDIKTEVEFLQHDVRTHPPAQGFDLILCRNLVFTYFQSDLQHEVLRLFADALRDDGALVLGAHERLPADCEGFRPWEGGLCTYRKAELAYARPPEHETPHAGD
jgi:chemotaxis protein methyltransferase CheR